MSEKSVQSPLHRPSSHESAWQHVSGEAIYIDDMPPPSGMLVAQLVVSPVAHGRIVRLDTTKAAALPGVAAVLTAQDIPGVNDISAIFHDEPLLATTEVLCQGQAVALVVGDSYEACRRGVSAVELEIEALPAVLDVPTAIAQQSMHAGVHVMRRGDVDTALASSALKLSGVVESPDQDHWYLETHVALAILEENRTLRVYSSTQHPAEVQAKIGEVLGIPRADVVVLAPRMGGGFGGKETQGAHFAALASLAAWHCRRPVKVWLNRDQDMMWTGKRHPFYSTYEAGFDTDGRICALKVQTYANAGWAHDLSRAILDRCLFHLDNTYFIPNLHFEGRIAKTHLPSNTAYRGFGGPQGIVVIESVLNRAARKLGLDPAEVRQRNFYGEAPRNRTPYDQEVVDSRARRIYDELMQSSRYHARQKEVADFNAQSRWIKRGLAFQPVKFGISFTNSMLNQAGALVLIYTDGTVQINHGGTEMGQGLHTKMRVVAAHCLGLPQERIRVMHTATDKVPNTAATAASSGADLNGQAVHEACRVLVERLRPVAARMLGVSEGEQHTLCFAGEAVSLPNGQSVSFSKVVQQAYVEQISLSATGYYRTPDIWYDAEQGRGKPFHYFAYGAAVLEVEVNGLTGEHRLLQVDILHDVGDSLIPSLDRGQVEGAFIQGLGWLTCEELIWDDKGFLRTHSPDTYKIPSYGTAPVPERFSVQLLEDAAQAAVIHGSKAVGEPPFMLAIGVMTALQEAVLAFTPAAAREVELRLPCTAEAVLRAIHALGAP